jgi:hypothetical protein
MSRVPRMFARSLDRTKLNVYLGGKIRFSAVCINQSLCASMSFFHKEKYIVDPMVYKHFVVLGASLELIIKNCEQIL